MHLGLPVGPGTHLPVIFEFVTVGPWNTLLTFFFSFTSPSPSYLFPSCICILGCLWAQEPTCPLYLNSSLPGPGILFSLFSSPLPLLSSSFLPTPFMHFGQPVGPGLAYPKSVSLLGPGMTLDQITIQFIPHFLLNPICSLHAFAFWSACGPGTSLPNSSVSLLGPGITLFSVFFSFTSHLFLLPIYSVPAFGFWAVCRPGPTQLNIYCHFWALE